LNFTDFIGDAYYNKQNYKEALPYLLKNIQPELKQVTERINMSLGIVITKPEILTKQ